VVSVSRHRSFVIADIPGLIEGAADGVGLGIQFLKHLQRTRLLLHIVDLLPDEGADSPLESAQKILNELRRYDESLYAKPRWLVLNKTDLLSADDCDEIATEIARGLDWQGPVYRVSAINGEGVDALCQDVMDFLESDESI
jgi:GTP-binding protein